MGAKSGQAYEQKIADAQTKISELKQNVAEGKINQEEVEQQRLELLIKNDLISKREADNERERIAEIHVKSNKDGLTSSLINIAANAYQYRNQPISMGGGGGKYTGYAIPIKMASDDNGKYFVRPFDSWMMIIGKSSLDSTWEAMCTVDSLGATSMDHYSGW